MWTSVQQNKCRVLPRGSSQTLSEVQGRGPLKVGPGEEPPSRGGSSLPGFGSRNVRGVQRKREQAGQPGRERFITGRKKEGDWF